MTNGNVMQYADALLQFRSYPFTTTGVRRSFTSLLPSGAPLGTACPLRIWESVDSATTVWICFMLAFGVPRSAARRANAG